MALDQRVREGLARSLNAIFQALSDEIELPRPALEARVRAVRAGPVDPAVFALYTDLVRAIEEDDVADMDRLCRALADPKRADAADGRIATLHDDDLGPGMAERFARLIGDDASGSAPLEAVTSAQFENDRRMVEAGLDLLDRAAPELGGEIGVFGRKIVLAVRQPGALIFGGASTFYLWGCVFLNPAAFSTRVQMAEALTHEAAHLLLFGMTNGNPMVENPDEERYPSPLRLDPRPMEGIVHATYVLARMSHCLDCLARSPLLSGEEQVQLAAAREDNRRLYGDGLNTIQGDARFTPVGEEIFASCLAHNPG